MKATTLNTDELKSVNSKFPGLDQVNKKLTIQFECYGFSELYFIRQSIYNAIDNLQLDGGDEKAKDNLLIARHLVNICKQIDQFEINEFVDNIILNND
ncbi:hypothetical protein [Chryseobacterium shandongense]|uniref:Uncharacterized protein n=1 Tax=Chryseobacterium shandongense TaxID=1493872 RepID=A0ABN5RXG7_9FLAO|nr:hypothetical protein [Chryseobacterium shandongense]AZA95340.1 hypothetical protein EG353_07095 [Chryseobacterium shandongense]